MDENNLDEMKYSEIRTLAKSLGIKANMKVDKLRKAITKHYKDQNETSADDTKKGTKSSSSENDESEKENSPATKKSRGRGKRGRKATSVSDVTSSEEDKLEDSEREISPVAKKRRGRRAKTKLSETRASEDNTEDETTTKGGRGKKNKTMKPKRNVRIASPEVTAMRKSLPSLKSPLSRTLPNTPGSRKATPSSNRVKSPSTLPNKKRVSIPESQKLTEKTQKRKRSGSETRKSSIEESNTSEITEAPENKKRRKSSTSSAKTTPVSTPKTSSGKSTPRDRKSTSPGVKSLIKAMDGLTSEEMKANLLQALDKKAKEKAATESPKSSDETRQSTSGIPRFTEFLAKKKEQKKDGKKGVSTPDWKKIHKKEFSKWDSIEVYMEKKKKRAEGLTGSLQKAQRLLQETQSAVRKLNNAKTPQITKPIKPDGSRPSFQSPKVFKPTTLSTKELNLKFGPRKRSQDSGSKISSVDTKTPNATPNPVNSKKITPKQSTTRAVTPKSTNSRAVNSKKTASPKKTKPKTVTPKPASAVKVASQAAKSKTTHGASGAALVQSQKLNRKSVATPVVASKVTSGKLNETFSATKTAKPTATPCENIENKRRAAKRKSPGRVNYDSSLNGQSAQRTGRKSQGDGLQKGGTPFKFSGTMNTSVNLNTSSMKKSSFDLKASLSKPLSWKPHKGKLKPLDLNTSSYKHIGLNKTSFKTPQTKTIEDRRLTAANNRADKKFQAQMNKRGITS